MNEQEKIEEKNKRVGWLVSVSTQLVLLIVFYFLIAWKPPFPPIPEYGIELGFLTETSASASRSVNENTVEEDQSSEQEQESTPPSEASEPTETESENLTENQEVEAITDVEADVTEETFDQNEETEINPVDEEQESQETSEEVVEAPEENPDTENEESTEEEPEPTIDSRSLYGTQGTSTAEEEGSSLALAGWIWDFKPEPKDTSDETGKIVYKIVVDQDGYLIKIETRTSTVSPAVERKYREAVQKLTFSKTSDYKPAPQSAGTLTFIIKTK